MQARSGWWRTPCTPSPARNTESTSEGSVAALLAPVHESVARLTTIPGVSHLRRARAGRRGRMLPVARSASRTPERSREGLRTQRTCLMSYSAWSCRKARGGTGAAPCCRSSDVTRRGGARPLAGVRADQRDDQPVRHDARPRVHACLSEGEPRHASVASPLGGRWPPGTSGAVSVSLDTGQGGAEQCQRAR